MTRNKPICKVALAAWLSGCQPSPPSGAPPGPEPSAPVPKSPSPFVPGNAPAFAAESVNAGPVTLGELRGKAVLLCFFAGWCGPCVQEMPHEKTLYRKYQGQPFQIIGISSDHSKASCLATVKAHGLTWPIVHAEAAEINKLYGVDALPTFVLVDKRGNVAGRWTGGGQSAAIEAAVVAAINR